MMSLQLQFDLIEAQRRAITAQIEALTEAKRAYKTKPGDWSALQIAEHLILGDETVGARAWSAQKMAASGAPPRFYALRFRFILAALRRNIRLPLPSPEFEPRGETAWPELAARWENSRSELRSSLESPDFEAPARPFFHTIAGALTTRDFLELSEVHTAYHARQLARLVARLVAEISA